LGDRARSKTDEHIVIGIKKFLILSKGKKQMNTIVKKDIKFKFNHFTIVGFILKIAYKTGQ
jgi:hypothetical protein